MCHCVTNRTTQSMCSLRGESMKTQARLTCAHIAMGQTKTQRRRRKSHKNHARSTCASLSLALTYSHSLSRSIVRSLRDVLCSAQLGSSLVAAPGPILNVCAPRQYRYRTLCPRLRRRRRIAAALRCALRSKSTPGRWVRTGARTRASWSDSGSGSCLCSCVLSRLEKCRLIAITESKSERKNERKKKQSD